RQRQSPPDVSIHMAVREMMRGLPQRPTTIAVGCLQLRFAESLQCGAEFRWRPRNLVDSHVPEFRRNFRWRHKFSDGVAWVHDDSPANQTFRNITLSRWVKNVHR